MTRGEQPLSRAILVGVTVLAVAAGCGGAHSTGGIAVPKAPPDVVGLRVPAAIARLGQWRYRLTSPLGEAPARKWIVCSERAAKDARGPLARLIATPVCPYLAPRLIGMTVDRADAAVYALGAADDVDTAAAGTTKADVLVTWTVCSQDPAPGRAIGLDPAGASFAFFSLSAAPRC